MILNRDIPAYKVSI